MDTWSSLLHYLVTLCLCVGMPQGNASFSLVLATTSMSFSAPAMASIMNNLTSLGLS
jgi:hypothetical protein